MSDARFERTITVHAELRTTTGRVWTLLIKDEANVYEVQTGGSPQTLENFAVRKWGLVPREWIHNDVKLSAEERKHRLELLSPTPRIEDVES